MTDRKKPLAIVSPLKATSQEERVAALLAVGIAPLSGQALDVEHFISLPRAMSVKSLTAAIDEDRGGR